MKSPVEASISSTPEDSIGPPAGTFAALRHRNYQLYFGGQLVSNAGTWMQTVAQGWLVWELSHSGLMLGVVGFASAIPSLLVTPWGGVVVDRMPKRRLLMMTQSGAMLLAFILAALTFTGAVRVWHIVLLAAGLGFVNAFDAPARQAFVVDMVGRDDLPNAIALNSLMFNSARVIGPGLGGLLLAAVGAAWCFTINGASFLAVLIGLWAMRISFAAGGRSKETPWRQLGQGVAYLRSEPTLGGILWLSLCFSVFGMAYFSMLPAFVERVLHQGAVVYGWVMAATGVGAVTGALLIATRRERMSRGMWLIVTNLTFPLLLAGFAFAASVPVSFILAVGLGFGFMSQFTMMNTLLQTRVDDRLRGRVMSIYTLTFFGFAPFGNLAVGALSERIGLSNAIGAFAVINLILALIIHHRVPGIRKLP
ncbi:MAG TPA: MFS transporter [Anaerolineales bacterium]|nr:MFS transporter [Anaerolineales bacterium]